jgi:succinoglycan biosynthesis transport protein ExoP
MADHPLISRDSPVAVVTPAIPVDFYSPGLSIPQIFSILWAHRGLGAATFLAVLTLTAVLLGVWPRTYTAIVTLMVNYEVNDPLNGKELPLGQVGSYIATQVELMQTPEVLLAVVDRLHLTEDRDYAHDYPGDQGSLREWVAAKLSKGLTIYQGQMGSQLIYIKYSANHAKEAARIANTVADVYIEQDLARSTGPPGERAQRYAQQLEELKAKVEQAQQAVTAFQQRHGVIDQLDKANVDAALLATLEGRLLEAQNERRVAEGRASADQSLSDQVLSSTEIESLKTQLATQETQLAHLDSLYYPKHPQIVDLKAQIAVTQRMLATALRGYAGNAAAALGVARRLEASLQQAVAEQRSALLVGGALHDQAAKYQLELDSASTVYRRALEGYDQILFASAGHYTNVALVSRATPPVKATKPRMLAGLALGGLAAVLLGLAFPLGYELLNRRVRCRDDLERHHRLPVLIEFPKYVTEIDA